MKNPLFMSEVILAFLFLILFWTCRKNPVGPVVTQSVQLSAEYVGCTEVFLSIGFADNPNGGEYRISRQGTIVLQGSFQGTSTTVIDTTTLPQQTYTYTAYKLTNGEISEISPSVEVTTLDSTSHDYSWQVFYFGGAASSYLMDVSIVNDTDVWAVGQIYVYDSTGKADPYQYNAIHWDGKNWSQLRVYFPGTNGLSSMISVFAISTNDVWTGSTEPLHWNGSNWIRYDLSSTTRAHVTKIWGTDSSNVYLVGDQNGAIAHYDGHSWQEVPTGTTLPIQDIWGRLDSASGGDQVVALASDWTNNNGEQVVRVSPTSSVEESNTGLPWSLFSIWSPDSWNYYVCGDGIYRNHSLNTSWTQNPYQAVPYTRRIRGNNAEDFVIVGDFGLLVHYNGSTYREYNGHELPNLTGNYWSVDMKSNLLVAVGGLNSGQAIAVIGKR